ncbi:MAG: substrate-binding domain-containing protein [Anaerolineales bacterium]|nr:substrate-binding domain-containing protein [Anaerolineales bacterium]
MTGSKRSSRRKGGRPTIGLLIGRVGDIGYAATVWPGVAAVAEERDVNLICFVGGMMNLVQEYDVSRNVVYDLVSPQNVDGLVALSGSVGQFTGPDHLRRFYESFHPLPVISIAMELEGFPSVLVDNYGGMRRAVDHLIETHGFRRIAFIRGPETSPEAEIRYRAYRDALEGHGLEFDPDLVEEGDFLSFAGREAVESLVGRKQAQFEAVVSANDAMAISALDALQEHGLRIPEQVAVVGFDGLEETRYVVPPITTVRQPFNEQGRKAAELLLDRLAGKPVPEKVLLSTELIVRRSCGCFTSAREVPAAEQGRPSRAGKNPTAAARRRKTQSEMEAAAAGASEGLPPGWAGDLYDALTKSGPRTNPWGKFLSAWEDVLRQVALEGGEVMRWHGVLAALRRTAPPLPRRKGRSSGRGDWGTAEMLIGEIAQWAQANRRFRSGWHSLDFLTRISDPLMTAFDVGRLTDAVVQGLSELGIHSCYLSLFDFPDGKEGKAPSEWSRLILAHNQRGRVALESGGRRFPSRELVPKDILAAEDRFAFVLESLHFRDENQFGFILFGPLQTEVRQLREVLTRQIGTALKGAALVQEQRRAEEQLRADKQRELDFQERLRILLEVGNELSRAESKDILCRRAVELGRSRLGFDRLGIWFRSLEPGYIEGSFGTDGEGRIVDERGTRIPIEGLHLNILYQTRPVAILWKDAVVRDSRGSILGRADQVQAAMWTGENVVGFLTADNLLRHREVTDQDREILNLFASNLGYLSSRIQAEEALKLYSERLQEMVEERTRELRQAQENLVRQEKLAVLGQLAATVSHELRNPLATLRVSAADLDRKVRDKGLNAERPLDRIQRNISRCDNIITELLDYARMPAPDLRPVDFDGWLNRLLDEQALPPGITLVREIASGETVALDPERFRRVVINLVDNARQAMQNSASESGRRILTVRSKSDGDGAVLEVDDTGPGISAEVMERLFEPLFSTKGFGVGLGLAIVKGIVEQHGGEVRIASRPGDGTRATVRIPRG